MEEKLNVDLMVFISEKFDKMTLFKKASLIEKEWTRLEDFFDLVSKQKFGLMFLLWGLRLAWRYSYHLIHNII